VWRPKEAGIIGAKARISWCGETVKMFGSGSGHFQLEENGLAVFFFQIHGSGIAIAELVAQ